MTYLLHQSMRDCPPKPLMAENWRCRDIVDRRTSSGIQQRGSSHRRVPQIPEVVQRKGVWSIPMPRIVKVPERPHMLEATLSDILLKERRQGFVHYFEIDRCLPQKDQY